MYTPKTFNLPELAGISKDQVAVHLKLYEGYVTHVNKIADILEADREGTQKLDPYAAAELRRRFAFEFDGMRMHEYYFEQFEGGPKATEETSSLYKNAVEKYGSWDAFIAHVRGVATTRGIGWTVVYRDPNANTLHTTYVGDHELGQLAGLPIVLALDMWEHAFMVDYRPADKGTYIDAFFNNLNWEVVEKRV